MKFGFWFTSLMAVVLFIPSGVFAANANVDNGFKISSVKLSLKTTPKYQIQNYSVTNTNRRWLEVSVEYTVPKVEISPKKFMWEDDVTMEVQILFVGMYREKKVVAHATGSVSYWSIPMDGKIHYAMMFIAPQILERYGFGRPFKSDEFMAKVTFFKGRTMLAIGYAVPKKLSMATVAQRFTQYSGRLKSADYLDLGDVVWSRDKTPWAFIQFDKFDMIKPAEDRKR